MPYNFSRIHTGQLINIVKGGAIAAPPFNSVSTEISVIDFFQQQPVRQID
jgi:hypothetical protein